jgi:hypothetical protein
MNVGIHKVPNSKEKIGNEIIYKGLYQEIVRITWVTSAYGTVRKQSEVTSVLTLIMS